VIASFFTTFALTCAMPAGTQQPMLTVRFSLAAVRFDARLSWKPSVVRPVTGSNVLEVR
jgi:hypothetical protein